MRAAMMSAAALVAVFGVPRLALAAEVTDVASGGEKDHPVALNLDLRWIITQENGTIQRQFHDAATQSSYVANELNYSRTTNILDLFAHVGLARDFELHAGLPWIIQDAQNWQYAKVSGVSVQPTSTIQNNNQNAHGDTIAPTPLFTVPSTVYRGGIGDPTVGFSWGVFNDARGTHLPKSWFPPVQDLATWVIGVDYTIPAVPAMIPTQSIGNGVTSPTNNSNVGLGEHQINFWMAMSKRIAWFEPFVRIHYMLPVAASNAYDNCNIVGKDPNGLVMNNSMAGTEGQALCSAPTVTVPNLQGTGNITVANPWLGQTGLQPSQIGGVYVGTDFHPLDFDQKGIGVDISLGFNAEYISKGRNYTELTDVLGKLTYSDAYFNMGGQFTIDVRFSKYVHWISYFSMTTNTPHVLTMETVGNPINGANSVLLDSPEVNPNYDFRIDQPGRQFLITNTTIIGGSTRFSFNF